MARDVASTSEADAIEARDMRSGAQSGDLELRDSPHIRFRPDGMEFDPHPAADNMLFHDNNDRNLETLMQDLVENFMVFRQAAELIRSRFDLLNAAIAERV